MTGPMEPGLGEACRAYGLDPTGLTPLASVYRPGAAYRSGAVVLKPYRYREAGLHYATVALQHLKQKGFHLVPRLVPTLRGNRYLRAGERWWYAQTWVEGRSPEFPAELGAAASSLAAFHRAAQGCFTPWYASRSWRHRWNEVLADLVECERVARSGTTPFDRAYAKAAPAFLAQARLAVEALDAGDYDRLEQAARGEAGFCHRDCTAANLVMGADGQVSLIDPDTWGADVRLADLTRLILSGAGGRADTALAAVAAYARLLPLSRAERKLLPAALRLPRTFWWAGRCRYLRPESGVDPEQLLRSAIAGAPAWDACVRKVAATL